jgi:hypothetical protein
METYCDTEVHDYLLFWWKIFNEMVDYEKCKKADMCRESLPYF